MNKTSEQLAEEFFNIIQNLLIEKGEMDESERKLWAENKDAEAEAGKKVLVEAFDRLFPIAPSQDCRGNID